MNIKEALDIIHKNLSINSGGIELEAMQFIRKELLGDLKNSSASPAPQTRAEIKPNWCGYNREGCLHVTAICDKRNSGGCTFYR
jgi:hypothetical protein